ncbi:MAG: serine hydrolase [Victivallales bacterium]|nr:serine hydrolase [Victivallales bacterium]
MKIIIIAVHAMILGALFFPQVRKFFTGEKKPTPEVQPVTTTQPALEETMPKPDAPQPDKPAEVQKPAEAKKPVEEPKPPVETKKPAETAAKPAEQKSPAETAAKPANGAKGVLGGLVPYRSGHYKLGVKELSPKVAKAVEIIRSGILIDLDTHTILWEKNSSKQYPIASLTKMLTALMLLKRIETTPDVTLSTTVKVTNEDFSYIKSQNMGNGALLEAGDSFTLQEYLKCMVIASCNDAAYIIGKYLGDGDLATGVKRMNEQAKALGLNDMSFHTPNGLPVNPNGPNRRENQGSALSIAFLGECVMKSPEYMKWAGTKQDRIVHHRGNQTDLASTNHLLRDRVPGITGLKTGVTNGAGQCIALSCTRDKHTVILVVMGIPQNGDKGKRRDEAAKQLLDWAFQQLAK